MHTITGTVTRMTLEELLADHAALSGEMQRSQEALKIALHRLPESLPREIAKPTSLEWRA